jgi:PAS domain S-box-containing protein
LTEKLPQSDLFLPQLLDASVEGILAFDRNYRYLAWNKGMERISGLRSEDVLGKSAFDLFPFIKETGEDKNLRAALTGESTTSNNRPYVIPETGRAGFFKAYYSPLFGATNEIIGGIAVVLDITDRRQVEEAAQDAHQRLTFHVENSPLAVIEWDSDFRVSRWSPSAERLFGWTPDEVLGKHVSDWHFVFDEDEDAVVQVTNRQRVGTELLGVLRNRNYTKHGSVLYCEWYNSVLHDESGQLVSVLSLVLDVTDRKLAEEERADLLARERDLRRRAEEADRLKDEFLATLSHELRTPLTSILGWATLIRNGEVDRAENLDRALEIIERNARSQARLIDDLLDVSRIITGNLQLDVHPTNVALIVEDAIDALRPAADAKGIHIDVDLDTTNCLVRADPNRLRQVIWNVVMNAIKFTQRGGRVKLHLECVKPEKPASPSSNSQPASAFSSYVRLTVSDTGEGISPEFLPYVFHRFRQEEGSISRKAGGLGLGLAVVRHLVELHGGTVSAQSAGPGHGSVFTIDLPLAVDRRDNRHSESDLTGSSADRRGADGKRVREDVARTAIKGKPELGPDMRPLAGVRVLLVEDDDDSRNLLTLVLSRFGAELLSVPSSSEALDLYMQKTPDVIISDIGMSGMDGYEFIRQLRLLPVQGSLLSESADVSHHVIPAIALTGYATIKDRDRALAAGYQLHLAKPIEPEDLVAAIRHLIK